MPLRFSHFEGMAIPHSGLRAYVCFSTQHAELQNEKDPFQAITWAIKARKDRN